MSSAAALIEQARAAGIVLWYDSEGEIYTWARKGSSRDRRVQLSRRLREEYFPVLALLKLATLEDQC